MVHYLIKIEDHISMTCNCKLVEKSNNHHQLKENLILPIEKKNLLTSCYFFKEYMLKVSDPETPTG